MSGRLREIKNRIRSVESTKKITHAMEMVAAAKLRRFQTMMIQARPYTQGLQNLLERLNQSLPSKTHPFFEQKEEKQTALVLITSDSGLCGSYNYDLAEQAFHFLKNHPSKKTLIGIGKSGINGLKREGYLCETELTDLRPVRFEEILKTLKSKLESLYLENQVDAVYVIYSHFLTLSSYKETTERLLPLEKPAADPAGPLPVEYLFEPSTDIIFERLIPVYFEAKTRQIFLEAIVSEQIARMTAMHMATENAKEMIDALVLERNKARQASITKEIIEIVSGSKALKAK